MLGSLETFHWNERTTVYAIKIVTNNPRLILTSSPGWRLEIFLNKLPNLIVREIKNSPRPGEFVNLRQSRCHNAAVPISKDVVRATGF